MKAAAGEDTGGAGTSEGTGIVFVNPLAQCCHCKRGSFYNFLLLLKVRLCNFQVMKFKLFLSKDMFKLLSACLCACTRIHTCTDITDYIKQVIRFPKCVLINAVLFS